MYHFLCSERGSEPKQKREFKETEVHSSRLVKTMLVRILGQVTKALGRIIPDRHQQKGWPDSTSRVAKACLSRCPLHSYNSEVLIWSKKSYWKHPSIHGGRQSSLHASHQSRVQFYHENAMFSMCCAARVLDKLPQKRSPTLILCWLLSFCKQTLSK